MGTRPPKINLYGLPQPLQNDLLPPVVAKRAPTAQDTGYSLGQNWVNKSTGACYILGQVAAGAAVWVAVGGGAVDVQTLTGNTGGVINPVAGNINILGSGDLTVAGTAGTLTISNSSQFEATVSTTDATVTTIYTIPLGASAGTVSFDVDVFCFNSSGPKGGSFNLFGAARTDGTTGTIIGVNSSLNVVDGAFAVTATVTASANTALVRVTGLVGTNINWKCNGFYRKVT